MSRFTLAFRCFFRLLFRGSLPPQAMDYLPESAPLALPEPAPTPEKVSTQATAAKPPAPATEKSEELPPTQPGAVKPGTGSPRRREHQTDGALALLSLLQREGRLIDFLREPIDSYDDADIGAAVRDVHRGCKKVIDEHLTIEPVMPGDEEEAVTVPRGFDPGEVRLVGAVDGEPPFKGTLRHHGWRATRVALPTLSEGMDRHVLAPAEVEVS